MQINYEEILNKYDKPQGFRWPWNSDRSAPTRKIHVELELRLGRELELHDQVQDATFSLGIILVQVQIKPNTFWQNELRFAIDGPLAALTSDDSIPENEMKIIRDVLEKYSVVLIPDDVLDVPYTGVLEGNFRPQTWWHRYFDYE